MMKYEVKKIRLDTVHNATIEGADVPDAEIISGLKEFWAKIEDTIGDLTDLDHIHVTLGGEDGDIQVWGIAKSTDVELNRQSYRLTIERFHEEWGDFANLDEAEFEVEASKANVFYAQLSERSRGERFSSHEVRYFDLYGDDEGTII